MTARPGLIDVAPFAPVRGLFTYRVLDEEMRARARAGCRVVVPFGRGREVVGVVAREGERADGGQVGEVKAISAVLDDEPILSAELLELLLWAARYYCAAPGEVIRLALPSVLHAEQRERLRLTDEGRRVLDAQGELLRSPDCDLNSVQGELLRRLARRGGTLERRRRAAAGQARAVEQLIEKGWVEARTRRRAQPRGASDLRVVSISAGAPDTLLPRAPRQASLLRQIKEVGPGVRLGEIPGLVPDARALLRKLEEKGLVRCETVELNRDLFAGQELPIDLDHQLTEEQETVLRRLREAANKGAFSPFLLHGVTGSGKTEIYLRLIADLLDQDRDALVLVPEIALTPQLAARFRVRFGDQVAVLHSALSESERYEQWRRIRRADVRIAVGARSAVFAPLRRLGVIIVDEEHDTSFKQEEGVRYHARDLALVRAKRANALIVLGSATPSMESYEGARAGRLSLLEMERRATPRPLPRVKVIDLRRYRVNTETQLSAPLAEAVEQTLEAGHQAILFLNRRGFATFVVCKGCGHVFRCEHCSVSLTQHRRRQQLVCHYCGYAVAVPERCPGCDAERIDLLGFGTERIEAALQDRFAGARVARLDRDTAAGRGLHRMLDAVRRREVDILIGTQMVTKGHDFPHVTLVGVLCADLGLHFPDFRAAERTFQLLTQVAGRAGRGTEPGEVVVQTFNPDHPAIRSAQLHDYRAMFRQEMNARRELGYPPCGKLVAVHLDGADATAVATSARKVAERVRRNGGEDSSVTLLGPAEAPIQRLKGRTRWMLLLKARDRAPLRRALDSLADVQSELESGVRLSIDVDPMHML